ncbi:hypothetical protein EPL77_06915 [Clostridioides difficile]|nr:hypothetical protein CWR57_16430 [Clostridioides difficile]AVB35264.1 hypothetical protein C3347_16900 [Clostridioides difficile]AVB38980.1 hypothetical protein C3L34_17385 [Clostridioides difficile]AVB42612.1 hypothetical protein C3W74_16905 [Clostridioides difficile]AVB51211.1 hypothetical protein C3348_16910 [Clostridioides difficile]
MKLLVNVILSTLTLKEFNGSNRLNLLIVQFRNSKATFSKSYT